MWREYLKEMIGNDEIENYEVVDIARSGASGPRVVIVSDRRTNKQYAIKYGDTRIPILTQIRNREKLAMLFGEQHIPKVLLSTEKVMIMEAVCGNTFHDSVIGSKISLPYALELFSAITTSYGEVWKRTAQPYNTEYRLTRNPIERAQNVKKFISQLIVDSTQLKPILQLPVVVNGVQMKTLSALLDQMSELYKPPSVVVNCHGDPNADNLIVNGYRDWWIVDWEWVGLHDWRILVSHLIGWWLSNATFMKTQSSIRVDSFIDISYETELNGIAATIAQQAWNFAEKIGMHFNESNWQEQVNLQLAVLLLGDIRFINSRGRGNHTIDLLAKGLEILNSLS